MSLKMIDLLHDRNEFLEFLENLLDNKIKEISPIFKVKKKILKLYIIEIW